MKYLNKLAAAFAVTAITASSVSAEGLVVPNLSYRTGPFASTGIPLMNGQKDYMEMLNARDGGIGGVKIDFGECETGYSTEKGVECYEKTKGNAIVTQPWSTGITLQVLPKTNVDKIPMLAPGYGFSPMKDGKTFQWAIPVPVGLKEMQNQSAQWLQIRRERPDYVVMWGWGAMNAGAISEAVKTKFPMDKFIGVWWSGHDADLDVVGDAGKGYKSVSWSFPNADAPVMADIKKHVIDAGMSDTNDKEMNGVFYSRGVIISAILAEGITAAQAEFGNPQISAEQLRWGLENIDFTADRIKELGLDGMVPPFATACDNHTGHSGGWILEWDGAAFQKKSDLIMPNVDGYSDLATEKAAAYATENAPWAVNESCQ